MMKLNMKALGAMIGVVAGFGILIHDFIAIMMGASYTAFGMLTLIFTLAIASECYSYIIDRLDR